MVNTKYNAKNQILFTTKHFLWAPMTDWCIWFPEGVTLNMVFVCLFKLHWVPPGVVCLYVTHCDTHNKQIHYCHSLNRLAKCHHPHHPGWCKMFRAWVKFVTEHIIFCFKFNLLPQLCISFSEQVLGNVRNITFKVVLLTTIIFKGTIMILSLFYWILLLTLLCHKFGIAKYHALFGVKMFSLNFGW